MMAIPDTPISRKEKFYAKAAGQDVTTPEPVTREEQYLDAIAQGGGGGSGVTFYPSVSEAGVISWTNDGGLENPTPVDLAAAVINALPDAEGERF